jgi:hypothetical protein
MNERKLGDNEPLDMAEHEQAFTKWLHLQGDTTKTPVHMLMRGAYFEGAKYGLVLAARIDKQISEAQEVIRADISKTVQEKQK